MKQTITGILVAAFIVVPLEMTWGQSTSTINALEIAKTKNQQMIDLLLAALGTVRARNSR